jgi:hypothetical protein
MATTGFATVEEAFAFAATVLVTSGGKTHLAGGITKRHADGCDSGLRVHACTCVKSFSVNAADSACGALSRVSRVHQTRYASNVGAFIARNDALPSCAKCAKYV